MKPSVIGDVPTKPLSIRPVQKVSSLDDTAGDGETETPKQSNKPSEEFDEIDDNEKRLLHQEFLMKPNSRVHDFLLENGTTVNDFVRFECGEQLVENEKPL